MNDLSEINKVKMTFFYRQFKEDKSEYSSKEIVDFLEANGYPKINLSRLKGKMSSSRTFNKGKEKGTFKLSVKTLSELESSFPQLNEIDEIVVAAETIIPNSLFISTRGYIEKLCLQINGCYEHNYYDACAVCMRRLLEVLLILTYQKHSKESQIQDNPNEYKNLSFIINFTKSNNHFHISKGSLDTLDEFRKIGNLSAHRIQYNCKPKDINDVKLEYRACIEELLYKSGLK